MVEIFVVKTIKEVFKCLLPDGTVLEKGNGAPRKFFQPLNDFMDVETKIVYYPTADAVNDSSGEVEIQMYDTLEEAVTDNSFLKKIIG